ncbi:N-formylglutamate amidohydrolase [Leptolyngbya sp. FACHB-671]|jgi:N-formylglutamate amidohydrolase|uniref:N-formylglutamate amidohydrolase n=1 Tax=Leptolyngbya sp. FACHB-671 TaxID=2692812 RepID=UPI0016836689|nr:N-formylglutamate amidohydrolase [Leptolyngbya sp. FACHB-671]MBD1868421.1 N-formylglutamate amidohydrolase [Cyanobacteria bacterium FACHB-471]MBD2071316.1 N-formylglutamate amidohydrolase [Leptolyngbya sp. FACHB-671]
MTEAFRLCSPKTKLRPIVASLPHSGLVIPRDVAQALNKSFESYLPNQDWHLDRLYDFLPNLGITVLKAVCSRYVVDLNRPIRNPLFGSFWRSVIPEETAFNTLLYQNTPSRKQIEERIEQFYYPYHRQLEELLNQMIDQFGRVYLLDLHSFLGLIVDEVCLGNVNGQSCSEFLISTVESAFSASGYQVVRNKVFSGGYITQHYGQMPHVEALQIEIRYPTYLKQTQLDQDYVPDWDVSEFHQAKLNFEAIFSKIANLCSEHLPTG